MFRFGSVVVAAGAVLLPVCAADGLYPRSSAVLSINAARYQNEIQQSNHTSVRDPSETLAKLLTDCAFYAPWCGHCKTLQPAYEKAAVSLAGLAKVGAVNCDEEANKPFCGRMGVEGFPTLKIIRPGKTPGRPSVEPYQGPRTASSIVSVVKDNINNHVQRLTDDGLDKWLKTGADKPKAILFSDKGTTSALIRALAIDFLGSIDVAQVRDNQKKVVKHYGITSFPTFVLLPGSDAAPLTFDGKLEKAEMLKFLTQAASPNPDPAPKAKKAKASPTNKKSARSDASKVSKASASQRKEQEKFTQNQETLVDDPTDSPSPNVADASDLADLPLLPVLLKDSDVRHNCLTHTSKTCGLVFTPVDAQPEEANEASTVLTTLGELHSKYVKSGKLFPIYNVPNAEEVRSQLGVGKDETGVVVVNTKNGWLKRFDFKGKGWSKYALEEWIDSLRFGEGTKEKLKSGVVGDFSTGSIKSEASSATDAAKDSAAAATDAVEQSASSAAKLATDSAGSAASAATDSVKSAGKQASKSGASASSVVGESVSSVSSAAATATGKVKKSAASAVDDAQKSAASALEEAKQSASAATGKAKKSGSSVANAAASVSDNAKKSAASVASAASKSGASAADAAAAATDQAKDSVASAASVASKSGASVGDAAASATDAAKESISSAASVASKSGASAAGEAASATEKVKSSAVSAASATSSSASSALSEASGSAASAASVAGSSASSLSSAASGSASSAASVVSNSASSLSDAASSSISSASSVVSGSASSAASVVSDSASSLSDAASSSVSSASSIISGSASSAASAASKSGASASKVASKVAESVVSKAASATDKVKEKIASASEAVKERLGPKHGEL